MHYKTREGNKYNVDQFTVGEASVFRSMMREYGAGIAASSANFHVRWIGPVESLAKKYGKTVDDYVLAKIERDLVLNIAVQLGELNGEISDMLVDESAP